MVIKQKFDAALQIVGSWLGGRTSQLRTPHPEADVVSGAIVMSLLIEMRELAAYKPLGPKDIQIVIDSFFEKAQLVEVEHPMGNIIYQRKETT